MGKKGTEHVVNGADFAFRFAILGRGVGTRETKLHAVMIAKVIKMLIGIFFPIVTLELFYFTGELGVYEVVKIGKGVENLGLIG